MENPPFVSVAAEYGPFVLCLIALITTILIVRDPGVRIRAKVIWDVLHRRWSRSRG